MTSELQEEVMPVVKGVREGTVPLRTAHEVSRAADKIVRDKYAECRMEELGMRKEGLKESLKLMDDIRKRQEDKDKEGKD